MGIKGRTHLPEESGQLLETVRHVDKDVVGLITFENYPSMCGGGVHCAGQTYGQTVWDLANALANIDGRPAPSGAPTDGRK